MKRGRKPNPNLTVDEEDVLFKVAAGWTMIEIADKMEKTKRAVEHHCNMIREKLKARNLPHAVSLAYKKGILILENTDGGA